MDGPPTPEQDVASRLTAVETQLGQIDHRLGQLETSLRAAVADEVQGATAELRRAISELGRRLVQDLPHELRRHRDAIVAELRPPPPPPTPATETEPLPDPSVAVEEPEEVAVVDEATVDPAERRRGHRLRRRPS